MDGLIPNPRSIVRPASLADRVHADVTLRLQRGDVRPGDRLVDTQLAAEYGTSRMPVREALLRLVAEGFLTGTTRGFVVPRLSLDEMRDVFEVRRLLEPRAASQASQVMDADGLVAMEAALGRARQAALVQDLGGMIEANMAFRAAWLDAVPNRPMAETIGRFVDQVQAVRISTLRDPEMQGKVVQRLTSLHEAFARRDARAVLVRMTSFIAAAQRAFFRFSGASD